MAKNKHKEEIVIGVLIGVLVMVITVLFEPFKIMLLELISICYSVVKKSVFEIIKYLITTHEVNGLLLILLILSFTVLIFFIIQYLFENSRSRLFEQYTEDTLFNVIWRWSWNDSNQLCNLSPYCPECDFDIDFELVYVDTDRGTRLRCTPKCKRCNRMFEVTDYGDQSEVESFVTKEIFRKIRTNTYNIQKDT